MRSRSETQTHVAASDDLQSSAKDELEWDPKVDDRSDSDNIETAST